MPTYPEHESQNRILYNMNYLNLTMRQAEIHDIIMQSVMDTWPEGLLDLIRRRSEEYGFCGEIIVSCVADWIAERDQSGGGE